MNENPDKENLSSSAGETADRSPAAKSDRHQQQKRKLLLPLLLLAGSFFVFALIVGIDLRDRSSGNQTTETQSQEISPANILPVTTKILQPVNSYSVSRTYTGTVTPRRSSELGFQRAGEVTIVAVDVGDRVEAGTILAYLDVENLKATQQELLAQRRAAAAELQELQVGPRVETIAAARARVTEVRAQLEELQAGPRPETIAAARDRIAEVRAQLEELEAGPREEDIAAARDRVAEAKAQLEELEAGPREEDIAIARASVEHSQYQLQLARKMKERREKLRAEGAVSQEQLDRAALEFSSAEAQLDYSQNQLKKLLGGTRVEQIQAQVARLQQAQSNLDELLGGTRVEQIQAQVARLGQAQRDLDELLAGTRVEQIQAQVARVQQAQNELEELLAGTRPERVEVQNARLQELDARIAKLEIDLNKSRLRAPFSGTIAQRYLDEGKTVAAGESVVRLVEDEMMEVRVGVPVDASDRLQPGSTETVAIAGQDYSARVKSILPELDSQTQTVTVVFALLGANNLRSGEIASLKVSETIPSSGSWLPTTALVRGSRGLWSCFVLGGKEDVSSTQEFFTVERRDVEVLHTESDRAFVRGTLQGGDRIIVDGVHRLVSGQLVRDSGNAPGTR